MVTQVLNFLQEDSSSAVQTPGACPGVLGNWWYSCHGTSSLPFLTLLTLTPCQTLYFDKFLDRGTSVANWRKTIILSIHFYPHCQSRNVTEVWLPQLFGERLMKARTKKPTTGNSDITLALSLWYCRQNCDVTDQSWYHNESWYQYLTFCMYSPFQWLMQGKRPLNAGFTQVGFFGSPARSQRNWLKA